MSEENTAGPAPRQGLFRPAAVTAHMEAAGPGRQLPSSRRALRRAGTALALGLVVAAVLASYVRVDETSEGRWQRDARGAITVTVPVGALARLRPGQSVRLSAGEGAHADAMLLGEATPVSASGGAAAAVGATLRSGSTVGAAPAGKAVVRLDRHRLIGLVGDALGRGFGRG
jgi:hypothetical protein